MPGAKMKKSILLGFLIFSISCNGNTPGSQTSQPTVSPNIPALTVNTPSTVVTPVKTPVPSPDFIYETGSFSGKVYDASGQLLDGVKITAVCIDPNITWEGTTQTINGSYEVKGAPVGARLNIIASKPGYATRVRVEVLRSSLTQYNVFHFGGPDNEFWDSLHEVYIKVPGLHSMPQEPEVSRIKVNGLDAFTPGEVIATVFAGISSQNMYNNMNYVAIQNSKVGLANIDHTKLEIEMTFSNPVDTTTVENNFKIQSEATNSDKDFTHIRQKAYDPTGLEPAFTLDKNSEGMSFTWNKEDTVLLVKYSKELLVLKSPPQTHYKITFAEPFKDKAGKIAISATKRIADPQIKILKETSENGEYIYSTNGFIRYGALSADYLTFSVK
jgi:hypothetical protein